MSTTKLFASISDVKQIHPQFSTCQIDVLYKYENRNGTYLTDEAVERALPTIINIPIVGEYSEELKDFKGHGGKIEMDDDYRFVHTTKPYGVVPESAEYEWKDVRGKNGITKTYLTIKGCILWTGRYEEALSIIESDKGKGQSMEIIINSGEWDDEKDSYRIDSFTFSALCILGDNVNPAFEDSKIGKFTLKETTFKNDFALLMDEIETNLNKEGEQTVLLKQLIEKYSTSMEVLTAKGLNFSEISEDNLEDEIKRVLEIEDVTVEPVVTEPVVTEPVVTEPVTNEPLVTEPVIDEPVITEPVVTEPVATEPVVEDDKASSADAVALLNEQIETLTREKQELETQMADYQELKKFKLDTEITKKETDAKAIYAKFQLKTDDIKDIVIADFSLEEIEEKCYAILGRKLASNQKNFSLEDKQSSIKLPYGNQKSDEPKSHPYGDLFDNN